MSKTVETKFPLHEDDEQPWESCQCRLTSISSFSSLPSPGVVSKDEWDCIEVISDSGNLYYASLPFPCTQLWSLGVGLLISNQTCHPLTLENTGARTEEGPEDIEDKRIRNNANGRPPLLSLFHPYDEPKPVAILQQQPLSRLQEQWESSACFQAILKERHTQYPLQRQHGGPLASSSSSEKTEQRSSHTSSESAHHEALTGHQDVTTAASTQVHKGIRTPSRKRSSREEFLPAAPLVELFWDTNEVLVEVLVSHNLLLSFNVRTNRFCLWKIRMSLLHKPVDTLLPLMGLLRDSSYLSREVSQASKDRAIQWLESFEQLGPDTTGTDTGTARDHRATSHESMNALHDELSSSIGSSSRRMCFTHGGVGAGATTPLRTLSLVRRGESQQEKRASVSSDKKSEMGKSTLAFASLQKRIDFPGCQESGETAPFNTDDHDLPLDKIEITDGDSSHTKTRTTGNHYSPSPSQETQESLFPELFISCMWAESVQTLPHLPLMQVYVSQLEDSVFLSFIFQSTTSSHELCCIRLRESGINALNHDGMMLQRTNALVKPLSVGETSEIHAFVVYRTSMVELVVNGRSICLVSADLDGISPEILEGAIDEVSQCIAPVKKDLELSFSREVFLTCVVAIATVVLLQRHQGGVSGIQLTFSRDGAEVPIYIPTFQGTALTDDTWDWLLGILQGFTYALSTTGGNVLHLPWSTSSTIFGKRQNNSACRAVKFLFHGTEGYRVDPSQTQQVNCKISVERHSSANVLSLISHFYCSSCRRLMRCNEGTVGIRISRLTFGLIITSLRGCLLSGGSSLLRNCLRQLLLLGTTVFPPRYLTVPHTVDEGTDSSLDECIREELISFQCLANDWRACWAPLSIIGNRLFRMDMQVSHWISDVKSVSRKELLRCYKEGHNSVRGDIRLLQTLYGDNVRLSRNFILAPSTLATQLSSLKTPPGIGRAHTGFSLGIHEARGTTLNKEPAEQPAAQLLKHKKESDLDGLDLAVHLGSTRFPQDTRLQEICSTLRTSRPKLTRLERPPELDDHKWTHLQQKHLLLLGRRAIACCVGRGMVTFGSVVPSMADTIPIPPLTVAAKLLPERSVVNLDLGNMVSKSQRLTLWPEFHNGVASGLRVASCDTIDLRTEVSRNTTSGDGGNFEIILKNRQYLRSWLLAHIPKRGMNYAAGGLFFGFGLKGLLTSLERMDIYDLLSVSHPGATIGLLLGLAVSYRKSLNTLVNKALTLHLPAAIPGGSGDIEVPEQVQCAAILGLGYLYESSRHRLMSEFVLSEIGKYPLQPAGGKEKYQSYAYSFVCGAAFGLMNLSSDSGKHTSVSEASVLDTAMVERLTSLLELGHDWDSPLGGDTGAEKGASRSTNYIPASVTAPAAALALGLAYMKTEDRSISEVLKLPATKKALVEMHPFSVLQRTISISLINWSSIEPTAEWIERAMPRCIMDIICRVLAPEFQGSTIDQILSSLGIIWGDFSCLIQLHCIILAALSLSVALRFAGTADSRARDTCISVLAMVHLMRMSEWQPAVFQRHRTALFLNSYRSSVAGVSLSEISQASIHNICPDRWTTENCTAICSIACGIVMAGTGDVATTRILRAVRSVTDKNIAYGHHTGYNMAFGLMGLCGGRATFSRDNESIASLLISVLPPFPSGSYDNRYYPQFARHLYALSVERRFLATVDSDTLHEVSSTILLAEEVGESESLKVTRMVTPCLLPPIERMHHVRMTTENRYPLDLRLCEEVTKTKLSNGLIVPIKSLAERKVSSYARHPRLRHIVGSSTLKDSIAVTGASNSDVTTFINTVRELFQQQQDTQSSDTFMGAMLIKALVHSKWATEQFSLLSRINDPQSHLDPFLLWARDVIAELDDKSVSGDYESWASHLENEMQHLLRHSGGETDCRAPISSFYQLLKKAFVATSRVHLVTGSQDNDNDSDESREPLRLFDSLCLV
eukprot:gb/GECG01000157.1/.p1 GENE.gb/GECG01000157.1/~~gb/GECG01000157.1/.p1  ORF type:complete len:1938 (+),score=178.80 gb/GECG01000157.1/:1-5814(+)